MSKIKPRGKVPKTASVDEIIEIKTLIRHPMHSGRMKDKDGKKIPKRIIWFSIGWLMLINWGINAPRNKKAFGFEKEIIEFWKNENK